MSSLLHLMLDGALAAAEMLALALVPPAAAAPTAPAERAVLERPVQLHRLSTTLDVRLLGSLADVRVAQHLRNDGTTVVDLGHRLPALDEHVDTLRVVQGGRAIELLADDCDEAPPAGHVRLSRDEAIADALQLAPGAEATVEAIAAQPLRADAGLYRLALPVALPAEAPRAILVEQEGGWYLLVIAHRPAAAATVVLRPTSGDARWLNVGAVDARTALLIPLRSRADLDDVAEGAVEVELVDGAASHWSTVVAERPQERRSLHTGTAE